MNTDTFNEDAELQLGPKFLASLEQTSDGQRHFVPRTSAPKSFVVEVKRPKPRRPALVASRR